MRRPSGRRRYKPWRTKLSSAVRNRKSCRRRRRLCIGFSEPAVILIQRENRIESVATAGSPQITEADREAARGALSSHENTRGDTYPYVGAYFDFWPISAGCNCVVGVDFVHAARERPHSPEQIIEVIAASVAAAFAPRS